jgi:hypothetical protein
MAKFPHFEPGDVVAYRGVLGGKVLWACAATVVADSEDLTALYWRADTPVIRPALGQPHKP